MKKIFFLICFVLLSSVIANAEDFEVKTGYGYFKDSDNKIICKAELPIGFHPIKDGYTYVEVANKQEMDSIKKYKEPQSKESVDEAKIQEKIRELAVKDIQKADPSFKDPMKKGA